LIAVLILAIVFYLSVHGLSKASKTWIAKLAEAVVAAVSATANRLLHFEKSSSAQHARIETALAEVTERLSAIETRLKELEDKPY
jgi:hypothetical protein